MRGRCVPCDREYADLLTHLENVHPDIFGGETFMRRADGSPVVLNPATDVRIVNLDELQALATAAVPYWGAVRSIEVHSVGGGDDGTVCDMLANLDPPTVLLLIDLARKGAQQ